MSANLQVCGTGIGSSNLGASSTNYWSNNEGSLIAENATDAVKQVTNRIAGTYSKLYCVVLTNDRGASTLRFRKNAAAGNQVISIGASTTGEFEDTTNTDAVVAGDETNYQLVTGAGGTTFTFSVISTIFSASSNTYKRFLGVQNNFSTASSTIYFAIAGNGNNTTEANSQFKAKHAGTLQNFQANVAANARGTTTTYRVRKNTANGNQVISVAAAATGIHEDTSNTDSVAVNDVINFSISTGTGGGNIRSAVSVDYQGALDKAHFLCGRAGGATVAALATSFCPMGGDVSFNATEANVDHDANTEFNLTDLGVYVSANGITVGSTTVGTRKNAGAGNLSVSIAASTTGYFEDNSNTDSVVNTDELCYQVVAGTVGTTITFTLIGTLATYAVELSQTISDSFTLSDDFALLFNYLFSQTDTLALSDDAAFGADYLSSFSDSLSLSDDSTLLFGLLLLFSDSFTLSDAIATQLDVVAGGVTRSYISLDIVRGEFRIGF